MIFLNQILQGVFLGAYYALIACSLSFLFGVMRIINLAHGSLAVLAAFLLFVLADRFGLSPWLGLILVVPVMAALGWALQVLVLERSLKGGLLVPLLSTFGLAIVIDNLLFQGFGADTRSLAPAIGDLSFASWVLSDDVSIGQLDVIILAAAIATLGGLQLFLARTRLGRTIRATAEAPDIVGLIGIDARAVYALATAIALALAAIAGAFLALRATFNPYSGGMQLLFAFEAVVIGGFGSLWGTLIGGIMLGIAQNLGAFINPHGFLIAGHGFFLVVLIARLYAGPIAERMRFGRRRVSAA
ncbi:MAG: branched-chain amino acid ABC transporter permease [Acidibrevibacterium sp.]|uniref:branched-chain amino acid ABC transporter permease n=1 Tax=Acidibrevibacterium sp. TaxID=2606776 RepID=UPI003D0335C4